jgi:hypothetical protein
MKTCTKCLTEQPLFSFHKQKGAVDGYRSICKECRKGEHVDRYAADKESWNKRAVQWRKDNPDAAESIDARARVKHRDKRNKQKFEWDKANKGRVNFLNSKRYASKLLRTPAWLTEDDLIHIRCLYQVAAMRSRESGQKWHVDHIIPLQGETVSGLHVPSNLRVIPATENLRKYNNYVV